MFAVWFGEINMTKSYVEMNMCRSNGEVRKKFFHIDAALCYDFVKSTLFHPT
jgi:hypothetical protein